MLEAQLYDVIVRPIFTEKATSMADQNKYLFEVNSTAGKQQVKQAVEKIFDTEVASVNILNRKGKAKVFKGSRGKTSAYKQAIVTLKKGKTIEITAGA
jgi:large subunit ribosomal protein L23